MNAIERHYRLITIQERLHQLESELIVLTVATRSEAESFRLERAAWHAEQAAEILQTTSTEDLTAMLQLSIASVREQKRCQAIGNQRVPLKAERPDAANIEPFP